MPQRIRITTKADSYEERKRQYVDAGYVIESEQPTPINGLCSFVLVKAPPGAEDQ
jgi:hypothetical protein